MMMPDDQHRKQLDYPVHLRILEYHYVYCVLFVLAISLTPLHSIHISCHLELGRCRCSEWLFVMTLVCLPSHQRRANLIKLLEDACVCVCLCVCGVVQRTEAE